MHAGLNISCLSDSLPGAITSGMSMQATFGRVTASMFSIDWSRFESVAALRCAAGVAVPLVTGLVIDQPLVGVFGAAGAVGVGFGSFQGSYRGRAGLMLLAACAMAVSVFIGSLAGHSSAITLSVAAPWSFAGGLLVALGKGASFVGLQSIVALLIAGGYPSDLEGAVVRAALVLGGGLIQTFLAVVVWPLRRFAAERRRLAATYRSLSAYAMTIPTLSAVAPGPGPFAIAASPLARQEPFAHSEQPFIFQALLDEAERVRASLAALTVHYRRLEAVDRSAATTLIDLVAQAVAEIADSIEHGREPHEPPGFSAALTDSASRLSSIAPVEPMLGQLRAAWRTAGTLTERPEHLASRHAPLMRRRPPAVREALITLRANLTLGSTACRHALRLAVVLTLSAAVVRAFELPRGYWLPLTIALVLKPDFHDTFAFTIARVAGTTLGAVAASAVAVVFAPDQAALVVLVLACVWGAYGFVANYAAASLCIAGYVVFLMTLAGVPEATAAIDRIVYTTTAGVLALCAYVAWPTWAATAARPAIGALLEAQGRYIGSLLAAYAEPSEPDLQKLDAMRASVRLARSNAEAIVERVLSEPRSRDTLPARTAAGIIGAARRNSLAALSLRAGLEHGRRGRAPGLLEFASTLSSTFLILAAAVSESAPAPLSRLPQDALARTPSHDISDETDLIVESVATIAELLAKDAPVARIEE